MAVERELTIATLALDDLVPDPANARTHDVRNLDAIRGSLARFGQVEPIVVQRGTRRIVGGHGRCVIVRVVRRDGLGAVERVVVPSGQPADAIRRAWLLAALGRER
jgi:ParB-like chromosome segregation protein Spo0J